MRQTGEAKSAARDERPRRPWRFVVAGLSLAALALFAVLARLTLAPAALPAALRGQLVDRLTKAAPGWRVELDRIAIRLEPVRESAVLTITQLRLTDSRGRFKLRVPEARVELHLWPLFVGRAVLKGAATKKLDLTWHWSAARLERQLRRVLAPGAAPAKTSPGGALAGVARALGGIAALGEKAGAFADVENLHLPHVDILLVEDDLGLSWRLPDARIIYAGEGGRSESLSIGGRLAGEDGPFGRLALDTVLEPDGERRIRLLLEDVSLPVIAQSLPALSALGGVQMPLRIEAGLRVGPKGLAGGHLSARFGAGRFAMAPLYPEALPLDGLSFAVMLDRDRQALSIDHFTLEIGGEKLAVDGALILPSRTRPPRLTLEGGIARLSIADLVRYWPHGAGEGALRWIAAHITDGAITDARFAFAMNERAFETGELPADAFSLAFGFAGLDVSYLGDLPPLVGAAGRGRLFLDRLSLSIAEGRIGAQDVAGSRVLLRDIDDAAAARAEITLKLSGPLGDLLATLDKPPLGFPGRFGLAPQAVEGASRAGATLMVPLVGAVTLADVGFAVKGEVRDFRLKDFGVLGIPELLSPRLEILVDENEMAVSGPVRAKGISARLAWRERFHPPAGEPSSRFSLTDGRIAFAQTPWLKAGFVELAGDGRWQATLLGDGFSLRQAAFTLDLADARVASPWLGYRKGEGAPGNLTLRLTAAPEGGATVWRVEDFSYEAADARVRGGFSWRSTRHKTRLIAVDLPVLRLGRTELSVHLIQEASGPVFTVTGPRLDARQALERITTGEAPGRGEGFGFALKLRVDEILTQNEVTMRMLAADGRWNAQGLNLLSINLADDHGHPLSGRLILDPDCACRRLELKAEDAGRFALGFGLFENAQGGTLTASASVRTEGRRRLFMRGRAEVSDVTIVRRSSLVSVVEKGRETGLDAYVGEEGLAFKRIVIPFTVNGPIIEINDGRARGDSLGLTFSGELDRRSGALAVNGLVVPAFAINSLLGKIPLIGGIFGGKHGGLLAARYSLRGDIRKPEVSVNPMTLFMPGFLRKPFEGGKGRLPDQPPQGGADEDRPQPQPPGE